MTALAAAPLAANPRSPGELLDSGLEHDRRGNFAAATDCYAAAIEGAKRPQEAAVLSEALRRLAVLHNRRAETRAACDLA